MIFIHHSYLKTLLKNCNNKEFYSYYNESRCNNNNSQNGCRIRWCKFGNKTFRKNNDLLLLYIFCVQIIFDWTSMSLRSWTTCHLCEMVKLAKSLSTIQNITFFCTPFVCYPEAKLVRYRHLILNLVICVFYLYLVHQKDLSVNMVDRLGGCPQNMSWVP